MKISFSTYGWDNNTWSQFCETAKSLQFGGVEIDSVTGPLFADKGAPFYGATGAKTARETYNSGLSIPCIGFDGNIADADAVEKNVAGLIDCI